MTEGIRLVSRLVEAMTIPFTITVASSQPELVEGSMDQLASRVLAELQRLEAKFSAFRSDSLVSCFQQGDQTVLLDPEFQEVYALVLIAQKETTGAFDAYYKGVYDPTGLTKGWIIEKIFQQELKPLLAYPWIEAVSLNGGGDMQFETKELSDFSWKIGIESPEDTQSLLVSLTMKTGAVATSGFSKRGQHIQSASSIQQLTVVEQSLTQADVWATAGLVMTENDFLEAIAQHGLSGLYIKENTPHFFQKGELKID